MTTKDYHIHVHLGAEEEIALATIVEQVFSQILSAMISNADKDYIVIKKSEMPSSNKKSNKEF